MDVPTIIIFGLFYNQPLFFGFSFALLYAFFTNGLLFEPSRRLVVRMDLLPDSERLFIQKIGFNGNLYGQTVALDDLEKLDYETVVAKGSFFEVYKVKEKKVLFGRI